MHKFVYDVNRILGLRILTNLSEDLIYLSQQNPDQATIKKHCDKVIESLYYLCCSQSLLRNNQDRHFATNVNVLAAIGTSFLEVF